MSELGEIVTRARAGGTWGDPKEPLGVVRRLFWAAVGASFGTLVEFEHVGGTYFFHEILAPIVAASMFPFVVAIMSLFGAFFVGAVGLTAWEERRSQIRCFLSAFAWPGVVVTIFLAIGPLLPLPHPS